MFYHSQQRPHNLPQELPYNLILYVFLSRTAMHHLVHLEFWGYPQTHMADHIYQGGVLLDTMYKTVILGFILWMLHPQMKQPHFYSTSYKTGPLRPIFGFVNFSCVFLRTYKEISRALIVCCVGNQWIYWFQWSFHTQKKLFCCNTRHMWKSLSS